MEHLFLNRRIHFPTMMEISHLECKQESSLLEQNRTFYPEFDGNTPSFVQEKFTRKAKNTRPRM
jgi:hypothetical protein